MSSQSGYAHRDYAASLREFGTPRALPQSGGFLLERPIQGTDHTDLMGCYPIFCCSNWSGLAADLAVLQGEADAPVAVSAVIDPFADCDPETDLKAWFPDLCRPFKQHFVVRLDQDPAEFVGSHHRRNARRALKNLTVEIADDPTAHVDEWHTLYDELIRRHEITGISAFSRESFVGQLATPGMTMFRARKDDETVGTVLWYTQGDRAYYHLAAYTEEGYDLRASFAIFWTAIGHFADKVEWLSLGASAGLDGEATDGLSRFKKGWSNDHKTAWICGRILRPDTYNALTEARSATETSYFPAYRAGEFG